MRARWTEVCVALSVLGGVALTGVVLHSDESDQAGRATTSTTCQKATVDLTVGTITGRRTVFVQVTVVDEMQREWEVEGPTEQQPRMVMKAVAADPRARHGLQVVGDVGDGPQRTVQVRPSGGREWCEVTAAFS